MRATTLHHHHNGALTAPVRSMQIPAMFGVMSGGPRLEILRCLARESMDVSTIADTIQLDLPHVSHNLSILANHGLVHGRREGLRRVYGLTEIIKVEVNGEIFRVAVRHSEHHWLEFSTTLA